MRIGSLTAHIPVRELLRRTYRETIEDDGLGLAAQLAYYFFLALVPTLLFLLALASFFQIERFTDMLPAALERFAAPDMVRLLRDQLQQISNTRSGGILSLGLLGALWSSSAALVSIIDALNRAYGLKEHRPWWKVRLLAIGLTIGLAVFVLSAFTLVMAGPALADTLAHKAGWSTAVVWAWKVLQWPVACALICVAVGLIYFLAPDAGQEWVWVSPGALLATTGWLIASLLFRVYVMSFGHYQATYGALGGVVVLLFWMYITSLIFIVGAELNSEIEHASPWGKVAVEPPRGQRRKIGAAAERAFRERTRTRGRHLVPSPTTTASSPPATVTAFTDVPEGSVADYLTAFLVRLVWPRARRRSR